jgi:hypothetical protein
VRPLHRRRIEEAADLDFDRMDLLLRRDGGRYLVSIVRCNLRYSQDLHMNGRFRVLLGIGQIRHRSERASIGNMNRTMLNGDWR